MKNKYIEILDYEKNEAFLVDLDERKTFLISEKKEECGVSVEEKQIRTLSESETERVVAFIKRNSLFSFDDDVKESKKVLIVFFNGETGKISCDTEERRMLFNKLKHIVEYPVEIVF